MRWVGAIVVVAACGDKTLLVEIDPPDDSTKNVELFLVHERCDTCDALGPPASAKLAGTVYYLDDDTRLASPVTKGHARFGVEVGTDDAVLRMLAVGFDANGQAIGATMLDGFNIKDHLGEWWKIPLEARSIALPAGPFGLGPHDEIQLWRAPASTTNTDPREQASCVAVTHPDGTNDFISPPSDPDCDGFTGATECDELWYQSLVITDHTTVCPARSTSPAACMVGNHASCVDGLGPTMPADPSACFPSPARICVDDAMCSCPALDQKCVLTLLADQLAPKLECTLSVQGTGGAPPFTACPYPVAHVDLAPKLNGKTCPQAGFFMAPDWSAALVSSFPLMGSTNTGGFVIDSVTAPCQLTVSFAGSLPDATADQFTGFGVVTSNGYKLVMPFVAHILPVPDCSAIGTTTSLNCEIHPTVSTDSIWNCTL